MVAKSSIVFKSFTTHEPQNEKRKVKVLRYLAFKMSGGQAREVASRIVRMRHRHAGPLSYHDERPSSLTDELDAAEQRNSQDRRPG